MPCSSGARSNDKTMSHPKAVTDLAHWLVDNTASFYSVNRLTGYLKSLGHKAPKSAVSDYLAWFEDAYFLFSVRLFDASLARSLVNPKKVYCVDHSLVTSVSSGVAGQFRAIFWRIWSLWDCAEPARRFSTTGRRLGGRWTLSFRRADVRGR